MSEQRLIPSPEQLGAIFESTRSFLGYLRDASLIEGVNTPPVPRSTIPYRRVHAVYGWVDWEEVMNLSNTPFGGPPIGLAAGGWANWKALHFALVDLHAVRRKLITHWGLAPIVGAKSVQFGCEAIGQPDSGQKTLFIHAETAASNGTPSYVHLEKPLDWPPLIPREWRDECHYALKRIKKVLEAGGFTSPKALSIPNGSATDEPAAVAKVRPVELRGRDDLSEGELAKETVNQKHEQAKAFIRLVAAIDALVSRASPLAGKSLEKEELVDIDALTKEFGLAHRASGLAMPRIPDPNSAPDIRPEFLWSEINHSGLFLGSNRDGASDQDEWLFEDRLQIPEGWLDGMQRVRRTAERRANQLATGGALEHLKSNAERAGDAFVEQMENDPEFRAEVEKFQADMVAWHKSPEFQAWVQALRAGIARQNAELARRLLPPIGDLEAYKHLAFMIGIAPDELDGMKGYQIVARAKAWADAEKVKAKYLASALQEVNEPQPLPTPDAQTSPSATPETMPHSGAGRKRSTERGEGRAKLIAALTRHHGYSDGGCLRLDPIANNELARQARVSRSTASEFFEKEFQGHTKYRAICHDSGRLADSLKALNGEFSPHELYGRRPASEDDRDDE